MTTAAGWYHCSVKPISRSAGRSVVAAAAYRLGALLEDREFGEMQDYRRRSGIVASFTLAVADAPSWVRDPEELWNAAAAAENRRNSQLAREFEIALPSAVGAREREAIARDFAQGLVDRYGVAVTVAIHAPSRRGDLRNYHTHILATTREVGADGFGRKTRALDDRKTGPQEILFQRQRACDLINAALERAGSDERVDHRSFKDRGIDREPTEHLGPTATEIEREGKQSERGDRNRDIEEHNSELDRIVEDLAELDQAIAEDEERRLDQRYGPADDERDPPQSPEKDRPAEDVPRDPLNEEARLEADAAPFIEQIKQHGEIRQEGVGMPWWERIAVFGAELLHDVGTLLRDGGDYVRHKWTELVQRRQGKDAPSRDNDFDHER